MRAQLITPDYPQPKRGNSPPYIAETYMYLLRPASSHFASLEIPTIAARLPPHNYQAIETPRLYYAILYFRRRSADTRPVCT
jgi:hypothetical protein